MEFKPFENPWIKKIRFLTTIIVVSVAMNIGFIATFAYLSFSKKKKERWQTKPIRYEATMTNAKMLSAYFSFSFSELIKELEVRSLLQDGFTMRDLALACLVNYHYFDIDRAISGRELERRKLAFVHQNGGETFEVEVFPGLTDQEFQMIISFANRNKWPLTPEGLFVELQKSPKNRSLKEAFQTTSEFYAIFTAFNRSEVKLTSDQLLTMLLEGSWSNISAFVKERSENPGQLRELIRSLLKNYTELGSGLAGTYWIELEGEYVLRQLDDKTLSLLIDLLNFNSSETVQFLKKVMQSPRSDRLRIAAGKKLYAIEGIELSMPYSHERAMKQFFPEAIIEVNEEKKKKESVKSSEKEKRHLVQTGDSLWKLSRKYHVSMDQIRKDNHLKSDSLKPGEELIIRGDPHHPGAKDGT